MTYGYNASKQIHSSVVKIMAKSLRSKSRQRVKRVRRAKFYEREKKKCWEKHQALQADKNEQMVVEKGRRPSSTDICNVHSTRACTDDSLCWASQGFCDNYFQPFCAQDLLWIRLASFVTPFQG